MPLYLCILIAAMHFYLVSLNINLIAYRKFTMLQPQWFFRLRNLIISRPLLSSYMLPAVMFRIQFKWLLFVYKSLHNRSPSLKPAGNYTLRSSAQSLLFVSEVNCSTLRDRTFVHAAPVLWNLFAVSLRRTSCSLAISFYLLEWFLYLALNYFGILEFHFFIFIFSIA